MRGAQPLDVIGPLSEHLLSRDWNRLCTSRSEFVDQQADVIGPVPGTVDEEQRGQSHETASSTTRMIGLP